MLVYCVVAENGLQKCQMLCSFRLFTTYGSKFTLEAIKNKNKNSKGFECYQLLTKKKKI